MDYSVSDASHYYVPSEKTVFDGLITRSLSGSFSAEVQYNTSNILVQSLTSDHQQLFINCSRKLLSTLELVSIKKRKDPPSGLSGGPPSLKSL